MNKINLEVRFKNPVFIIQLIGAVLIPVLTYMGLTIEDMTSWPILGKTILEALSHPYVFGMIVFSIVNAINDPTTKGLVDSEHALGYKTPK